MYCQKSVGLGVKIVDAETCIYADENDPLKEEVGDANEKITGAKYMS